jgi:hypothetical protein
VAIQTTTIAFAEFWLGNLGYFDTDPDSFDFEQIQND